MVEKNIISRIYGHHSLCLLSGSHDSFLIVKYYYYPVYEGGIMLWFISKTSSLWCIDEVIILISFNEFTQNDLPPIFEDKTMDLFRFNDDYNSVQLEIVVAVMNNENGFNVDVLWSWSFSESYRYPGFIYFSIMVQIVLPKVMLPLFTKSSKYCLVQSIWKQYFREDDDYSKILMNGEWRVKPRIFFDD